VFGKVLTNVVATDACVVCSVSSSPLSELFVSKFLSISVDRLGDVLCRSKNGTINKTRPVKDLFIDSSKMFFFTMEVDGGG
jgi:hypothetical protein